MNRSRRDLLGAIGVSVAAGVAGCLGSLRGQGDEDPSGESDGGSGTGSGGADGDRLALPALDVQGSPGGEVVVNPANTVTLVDFFATWCAPCKPQMTELNEVQDAFPEVHLVSITPEDDEAAIRNFWDEYDGNWPVLRDPELKATQQFEARQMPTKLVFDAADEEVWRHVGLAADDTIAEQLRTAGA